MRLLVAATAIVASLALANSAAGRPPERETEAIADAEVLEDLCAAPIDFRATGAIKITTHFNPDGSVRFISEHPNINVTLTNPATGKSVTDRDVGLDKAFFNPDGTSDVLSTGIHFRVKAPGQGVIFKRIGLQIIHLDADGEFISVDIKGGNFDDFEDFAPAVCPALGSSSFPG